MTSSNDQGNNRKSGKESVTFIEDPFDLSMDEISKAQNSSEVLDFDEPEEPESPLDMDYDAAPDIDGAEGTDNPEISAEENPDEPTEIDASAISLEGSDLQASIESLVFVSPEPLTLKKIKELLGSEIPHSVYDEAIEKIRLRYQDPAHGFEWVEIGGGFQFRTKLDRAPVVQKLAKVQKQRLSRGAMESLAIVAYRQPVMREDIDKIRGVDSSHFIRILMDKKLIEISGRSELPGRPILYQTTTEFLSLFNLASLESLPPLKELESMIPTSEVGGEDETWGELRDLVDKMNTNETGDYNPEEDQQILAEIKERVKSISTSTPFLQELEEKQKAGQGEDENLL